MKRSRASRQRIPKQSLGTTESGAWERQKQTSPSPYAAAIAKEKSAA